MSGDAKFNKTESLLTVSELKKRYFHGVQIIDGEGNELPDDVWQTFINQAISWLETELDIDIYPTERTERKDFNKTDYGNWGFLQLNHFPIISIESWKAQYPINTQLITYPTEWFRIHKESGEVQLVPTGGSISNFFIPGGSHLPYVLSNQYIPQFFEVKYTSGFDFDCVPFLLNKMIGMKAAIDAFNIAGDLITGAGIANYSLSVDGISQSVGTTSSATNAGYGARVLQYEKQLKDDLKSARKFYKGINLMVT